MDKSNLKERFFGTMRHATVQIYASMLISVAAAGYLGYKVGQSDGIESEQQKHKYDGIEIRVDYAKEIVKLNANFGDEQFQLSKLDVLSDLDNTDTLWSLNWLDDNPKAYSWEDSTNHLNKFAQSCFSAKNYKLTVNYDRLYGDEATGISYSKEDCLDELTLKIIKK